MECKYIHIYLHTYVYTCRYLPTYVSKYIVVLVQISRRNAYICMGNVRGKMYVGISTSFCRSTNGLQIARSFIRCPVHAGYLHHIALLSTNLCVLCILHLPTCITYYIWMLAK